MIWQVTYWQARRMAVPDMAARRQKWRDSRPWIVIGNGKIHVKDCWIVTQRIIKMGALPAIVRPVSAARPALMPWPSGH